MFPELPLDLFHFPINRLRRQQGNSVYLKLNYKPFSSEIVNQAFQILNQTITQNVGFEVLSAVDTKSSVFWDITPYSPLNINRRFVGTCCFHLER
jgi:hypothetical protein